MLAPGCSGSGGKNLRQPGHQRRAERIGAESPPRAVQRAGLDHLPGFRVRRSTLAGVLIGGGTPNSWIGVVTLGMLAAAGAAVLLGRAPPPRVEFPGR